MARRKRRSRSTPWKKVKSALNFRLSRKTKKNLFAAGMIATFLFILFVMFYPHSEIPRKPKAKVPASSTPSLRGAVSATKQSPSSEIASPAKVRQARNDRGVSDDGTIVYYKRTPATPVPIFKPTRKLGFGPKLVFVIDDIGNTNHDADDLIKLGNQVTYAILPLLPHSKYFGNLSRRTGAEVILHLPLESTKGTIPGPGLITSAMSDDFVLDHLHRNMASVPFCVGVNNHMGSKGTADPRIMRLILPELKRRGLFFLDSMTTSRSLGVPVAREIGLSYLIRNEFLDNVDEKEAIRREINKMADTAYQKGHAIGIGHYRPNTLQVLQEEIPALRRQGFEIVSLRELLSTIKR